MQKQSPTINKEGAKWKPTLSAVAFLSQHHVPEFQHDYRPCDIQSAASKANLWTCNKKSCKEIAVLLEGPPGMGSLLQFVSFLFQAPDPTPCLAASL